VKILVIGSIEGGRVSAEVASKYYANATKDYLMKRRTFRELQSGCFKMLWSTRNVSHLVFSFFNDKYILYKQKEEISYKSTNIYKN